MKKIINSRYLIAVVVLIIIIIVIFLMLFQNKSNKNDVIDSRLYNIWNPHGATIEKDGNTTNYDDYDKEGYIVFSKINASRCISNSDDPNSCNNYEYTGTREYIDVKSDNKYLSGKYLYEITEDEDLILIKEQDDGSRILYTYGHPKG